MKQLVNYFDMLVICRDEIEYYVDLGDGIDIDMMLGCMKPNISEMLYGHEDTGDLLEVSDEELQMLDVAIEKTVALYKAGGL